jgi:hypothetical protein
MKNIILITMVLVTLLFQKCVQTNNGNVPDKIISAFNQRFPDVNQVKWEMENDTEWESEFNMDGKEYAASFNLSGEWMETEIKIKEGDLTEMIMQTIESEFPGYEIEEVSMLETPSMKNVYELELEKEETSQEVVITSDGKIIDQKNIEENDEDD